MLQETIKRVASLPLLESITICNEEHRFLVAEQLRDIGSLGKIILEPVGRNTAPAIALAALSVADDPLLLVMPADHVIEDTNALTKTVRRAIPSAESGKLVAFGILPNKPREEFGYIEVGNGLNDGFNVISFKEKPDLQTASDYIKAGGFFGTAEFFVSS